MHGHCTARMISCPLLPGAELYCSSLTTTSTVRYATSGQSYAASENWLGWVHLACKNTADGEPSATQPGGKDREPGLARSLSTDYNVSIKGEDWSHCCVRSAVLCCAVLFRVVYLLTRPPGATKAAMGRVSYLSGRRVAGLR